MSEVKKAFDEITVFGIDLEGKTSNVNGQSMKDCGQLWQKFEKEGIYNIIPNKVKEGEVMAVYHNYEGDHLQPFEYFIGCAVASDAEVPNGLKKIVIPAGDFHHVIARGKMPDCIGEAWHSIWQSDIERSYRMDFELYSDKSANWEDAEIDIYLS